MIQRSYSTYNNPNFVPPKITEDSRGTKIEEGERVAFNCSGDVVIGKIQKIIKNKWKKTRDTWVSLEFEIEIEREDGHVSKIKNPNSFVII
jgi:hypothetical protein